MPRCVVAGSHRPAVFECLGFFLSQRPWLCSGPRHSQQNRWPAKMTTREQGVWGHSTKDCALCACPGARNHGDGAYVSKEKDFKKKKQNAGPHCWQHMAMQPPFFSIALYTPNMDVCNNGITRGRNPSVGSATTLAFLRLYSFSRYPSLHAWRCAAA